MKKTLTYGMVVMMVFMAFAIVPQAAATTINYGDISLCGGFQSGNFAEEWDLNACDLVISFTYDANGLVPAVIQDAHSGEVLMVAYMNRDSLKTTLETGKTHFWSRSRQKYWMKGESSGHTQEVREVFIDCDADCVLIKVTQNVAACHTGYRSCFYRRWADNSFETVGEKVFDEENVYKA